MGILAKFGETAAAIGIWNATLFATSQLLGTLGGGRVRIVKYYITAQPVVVSPPERWTRTGNFELGWANGDCQLFKEVERPPEVIASRFAQGARCLVAASKGHLAGFLWFVVGPYEEDEVRVRFIPEPPGAAAWDFDVMVMPQFRMGRLFSYLWARATAELGASGVRHTMSRISAFNATSLSSHQRLGARIVGSAIFFCVGRWQLMRSSLAPHWHFSWRLDRRPTLTIVADRA